MDPQDPELDTNYLLKRAQLGDDLAVARIYERYMVRLRSWVRGRIPEQAKDSVDTEILAHDVLVRSLLHALDEGDHIRTSFRSYVGVALRNRLIDLARGGRSTANLEELELADDRPSQLEGLLQAQFEGLVRTRIEELPDKYRNALRDRFDRGMGYAAIAEQHGLESDDAARMRVNRALERLRDMLKGELG